MDLPRILVHAVYFGPLPPCFPLWLHTCADNSRLDWLLTTDQPLPAAGLPPNVRLQSCTLAEFQDRLRRTLQLPIPAFAPYKLCDFRPTWGLVCAEHNRGYDYWGHCDLDVLWGDLAAHFRRVGVPRYDRVLTCGHLSLYRNDPRVNHAFQLRHPDPQFQWHQVLTEPVTRPLATFDEHQGINRILRHHGFAVYDREADVADLHTSYPDHFLVHGPNYACQAFGWDEGRVFQYYARRGRVRRRELLYLHFQKRLGTPLPSSVPLERACLLLTQNGIRLLAQPPSLADLRAANPRHTFFPWLVFKGRCRRFLSGR